MDFLEIEWFFIQNSRFSVTCILPGRDISEIGIVTLGFAVFRLIFLAEMSAAGFVAVKGVLNHQLAELKEVRYAAGAFQRTIKVFVFTEHRDILPELFADL